MPLLPNLHLFRSTAQIAPKTVRTPAISRDSLTACWASGRDGRLECRWSLRAAEGERDLSAVSAVPLQAA